MTAAFRDSSGVVTGVNVTSILVPVPAGVVEGDLMIAFINLGPQTSTGVPAGWTHVAGSPHQTVGGFLNNNLLVMTRIADVVDEAGTSYTWNRVIQFSPIGGVIVAYSEALEVLDYLTISGHEVAHTSGDIEYVDTDVAAAIQLTAVALTGEWTLGPNSVVTASPGFAEREDVVNVGNGGHLQVQDRPSPGPSPFAEPITFSLSGVPSGVHSFVTLGIGTLVLFAEHAIIDVSPANTPAGPNLALPISFSAVGPENLESLGVAIRYIRDPNFYVIYETDVFTPRYAPDSSVANMGTTKVDFTIFEFGGWRGRIAEIRVFGIDAAGDPFIQDVLKGASL